MKTLKTAAMVASLGWAIASSMPAQAQTVGYNIRTGDVWVDTRLGEINDYGRRYRDPFVSEMTGYYGAPRSLVLDLLDRLVRARGRTLILVTHSAEVARRADRVVRLVDGRLAGMPT